MVQKSGEKIVNNGISMPYQLAFSPDFWNIKQDRIKLSYPTAKQFEMHGNGDFQPFPIRKVLGIIIQLNHLFIHAWNAKCPIF